MITTNDNKAQHIERLAAEFRHWHRTWAIAPLGSELEKTSREIRFILYFELSRLVTCKDCKYYEPPNNTYQLMYCSKFNVGLPLAFVCGDGSFELKLGAYGKFQLF